jgi:hypothetical protein
MRMADLDQGPMEKGNNTIFFPIQSMTYNSVTPDYASYRVILYLIESRPFGFI